jgi:hypothetical protein
MTPERRNISLLGNGSGKHIIMEAKARNDRRAVFSLLISALVATQRCGKHISAAVNQCASTEDKLLTLSGPYYMLSIKAFYMAVSTYIRLVLANERYRNNNLLAD